MGGLRIGLLSVSIALAGIIAAWSQTPAEPGLTPGVILTNISHNTAKFASVFPQVAVSRANSSLVAVAWRQYNLPIDTNALREDRIAECHVSISKDGGEHFSDRNMMGVLRTPGGNGHDFLRIPTMICQPITARIASNNPRIAVAITACQPK